MEYAPEVQERKREGEKKGRMRERQKTDRKAKQDEGRER